VRGDGRSGGGGSGLATGEQSGRWAVSRRRRCCRYFGAGWRGVPCCAIGYGPGGRERIGPDLTGHLC